MNSKGWKLAFIVLSALAISACGQKKKNKPNSPYAGIWVERSAMHNLRGARNLGPQGSCDSGRMGPVATPFVVHANGHVYSYIPAGHASVASENFLGSINGASLFDTTNGTTRHAMASGYYTGDLEATRLLPKSQLILERDVLIAQGYGQQRIFVAIDETQARVLWRASAICGRGEHVRGGVIAVPVGPGPDDDYQQGYPQQQGRPQQRPQVNQDDK